MYLRAYNCTNCKIKLDEKIYGRAHLYGVVLDKIYFIYLFIFDMGNKRQHIISFIVLLYLFVACFTFEDDVTLCLYTKET